MPECTVPQIQCQMWMSGLRHGNRCKVNGSPYHRTQGLFNRQCTSKALPEVDIDFQKATTMSKATYPWLILNCHHFLSSLPVKQPWGGTAMAML